MADYRVELPVFRGPLDLLLYLVKRNEVEIADIPIATITEQYLQYLEVLQKIDVDAAGEFLVMASTLMEIKSRLLLPRPPQVVGADEEDPRGELIKQLVEYKKFRDAADQLETLAEQQATRRARQLLERPETPTDLAAQPLQQVELWDLVSAFDRLVRSTLTAAQNAIVLDETSQQDLMESIINRLKETPHLADEPPRLEFTQLFSPPLTRGRCIGLFLALLELIKARQVDAEQAESFGSIFIVLLLPEPTMDGGSSSST